MKYEALQRTVTGHKRQLDSMRQRLGSASDSVKSAIQNELDSLELRILRSESMLDARRAEYGDLPRNAKNYMPVTLRFGVIESRSDKRALGTLSKYLKSNNARIMDAAASRVGIDR